MIARVIRWLRVVMPPTWIVLLAVAAYLAFELIYLYAVFFVPADFQIANELRIARDAVALMICTAYGAFRVLNFHPLVQPQYRKWLALTPWRVGRSLPMGPIHLVTQDFLFFALIALAMYDSQLNFALVPICFLLPYIACLAMTFWLTGMRLAAYCVAFGLGLVVRIFWWDVMAALIAVALLHVIGQFGLRRSLALFPWYQSFDRVSAAYRNVFQSNRNAKLRTAAACHPNELGWPFSQLHGSDEPPILTRRDCVGFSLLFGWFFYVVLSAPYDQQVSTSDVSQLIAFLVVGATVIGRLLAYCLSYQPPISFAGRVFTGRWIIPSYDRVFVAPLLVVLVATGFMAAFSFMPISMRHQEAAIYLMPICTTVVMLIGTCFGPSLRTWRLTGHYRLTPLSLNQQQFEEI